MGSAASGVLSSPGIGTQESVVVRWDEQGGKCSLGWDRGCSGCSRWVGFAYPKLQSVRWDATIAKSVIFTLDAGSSGFPQMWAAYRVLSFPLVQNTTTGRVEMEGADKLLKFQTTPDLCQVSKYYQPMPGEPVRPFGYKIDSALHLTVFNKTTGKTVATLKGTYANRPFPTKSGSSHTAYVDFPAGDKTLSLVGSGSGSSYIVHPTVADNVNMECEREPKTFNNLD